MSRFARPTLTLLACVLSLSLAACGGGGGSDGDAGGETVILPGQDARTLIQFGYRPGTGVYDYGYRSIAQLAISGAPADADMSRFAMSHNGRDYLLYAFNAASDRLYLFLFDGRRYTYAADIFLRNVPADASVASVAATYSPGTGYSVYLRSAMDPTTIYQFQSNNFTGPYTLGGGLAFPSLATTGAPADADFDRWTIFYDGATYRQAIFQRGSVDTLYQFGWNGSSYEYGHASRPTAQIVNAPAETYQGNAKILHDGTDFRLYQLAP